MSKKNDSEKLQLLLYEINGMINTCNMMLDGTKEYLTRHYIQSKINVLEAVLDAYEAQLEDDND